MGRRFSINPRNRREMAWEVAVAGFLLSFVCDLATNLLSALTISWFDIRLETIVSVMISGIPFAAIHEVSNEFLFFLAAVPLLSSIERVMEGGSNVTRWESVLEDCD